MIFGFLFMLAVAVLIVVPFWKILQRLGYSPYLSLLTVLPFLNIGLLYFIAFTDWPVERGAGPPQRAWAAGTPPSATGAQRPGDM